VDFTSAVPCRAEGTWERDDRWGMRINEREREVETIKGVFEAGRQKLSGAFKCNRLDGPVKGGGCDKTPLRKQRFISQDLIRVVLDKARTLEAQHKAYNTMMFKL
jgi:hypothetical protein